MYGGASAASAIKHACVLVDCALQEAEVPAAAKQAAELHHAVQHLQLELARQQWAEKMATARLSNLHAEGLEAQVRIHYGVPTVCRPNLTRSGGIDGAVKC